MHRFRPTLLSGALALGLALAALPLTGTGTAAAATIGNYQSNCAANLRTSPSVYATARAVIPANTVVRVIGLVSGSWYSTTCPGYVSGSSWYVINVVEGRPTYRTYGVSQLYVAAGLFRAYWSSYLEGVDVSGWQGTVDFSAIRNSGRTFVIAKATEGQTWSDPTYAANRSGAGAVGLAFAAYHFAQPSGSYADAVAQADHFVNVAAIRHGDLLPVLDVEVSNGLSASALQSWIANWLNRVYARTGAKALIYSNATFWVNHVGDFSTWATNGYRLWLAAWNTTSPWVPASNWAGTGWTLWQYSSCGAVPGISGCADVDRYYYTDFGRIIY